MWYRLYDGPDEAVGPLLAGRLRGRAQQLAMNLRLPDPHGHVDVGDAALVRLSVDEVADPVTGAIIQQAIPSGVQALLHALRSAFGEAEQVQATKALEVFFEFRRGRLPIPEWSVQWELNWEEAVLHLLAFSCIFVFFFEGPEIFFGIFLFGSAILKMRLLPTMTDWNYPLKTSSLSSKKCLEVSLRFLILPSSFPIS